MPTLPQYEKFALAPDRAYNSEHRRYVADGERYKCVLHFHEIYELAYFNRTSGMALIDSREGAMEAGMFMCISSYIPHDFHFTPGSEQDYYVIQFEPSLLRRWFKKDEAPKLKGSCLTPCTPEESQRVVTLMDWHMRSNEPEVQRDTLKLLLRIAEGCLVRDGHSAAISEDDRGGNRFEELLLRLDGSPREYPDLDGAAGLCGLSRFYFTRLFKQSFGMTYNDYLVYRRLSLALTLLIETDRQITQVAFDVGINDPSYFCKLVKENLGQSPLQIRKSAVAFERS